MPQPESVNVCWQGEPAGDSNITRYAYERVQAGQRMPGVIEVSRTVPLGMAIEDILLLAESSHGSEWEGQILYLPLR